MPPDDDKLDQIIEYLHRMDRRDRLRTIGSTIKSLISIGTLVFFIWSGWYLSTHTDDILKKITDQATKSAMSNQAAITEQITNMLNQKRK